MDQNVGISMHEFEQLQIQMVTLKTEIYELQAKLAKQNKEIVDLKGKHDTLTTENAKLSKIVSRDKGAGTFEKLVKENERLLQQESDFQLQCQTLIAEITQLSSDKELLSQSVEQYRQVINEMTTSPGELDALKTEVSALREECNRLRLSQVHRASSASLEKNGVTEDDAVGSFPVQGDSRAMETNDSALLDLKMQLASIQNERKLLLVELDEAKKQAANLQSTHALASALCEERQKALDAVIREKDILGEEFNALKARCATLEELPSQLESIESKLLGITEQRIKDDQDHATQVSNLQSDLEVLRSKYDEACVNVERLTLALNQAKENVNNSSSSAEFALRQLESERENAKTLTTSLEKKNEEISDLQKRVDEASEQIEALMTSSEDMEQQIAESVSNAEMNRQEIEDLKSQLAQRIDEVERLTLECTELRLFSEKQERNLLDEQERLATLESSIEEIRSQKDVEIEELRKEIQIIRQNAQEELITNRRKDAAKMKDLQRQLKTEKRRVEQLQERLEQLFQQNSSAQLDSSPHQFSGLSADFSDRKSIDHDFETSSVSSFSISGFKSALQKTFSTSGASAAVGVHSSTPSHSLSVVSSHPSDPTANELASQIAKLNLENDRLREKIGYLETTSASLADDVLKKQQVIDYYLMTDKAANGVSPSPSLTSGFGSSSSRASKADSPAPIIAFKNLFDKASPNNNAQAAEETKRLRRAMEEILTKNMSLEADLQRMSDEHAKLLKELKQRTSTTSSTTSTVTH